MLEISNLNPVILNRELMKTEVLLSPWSENMSFEQYLKVGSGLLCA